MNDMITRLQENLAQFSTLQLVLMVIAFLVFLFIPTFLGLIRNRKHIGKIFLLNIPAAFTFTSWFLLMGLVLIKFDDFAELKRRFTRKGASGVDAKADCVDADAA